MPAWGQLGLHNTLYTLHNKSSPVLLTPLGDNHTAVTRHQCRAIRLHFVYTFAVSKSGM